MVNETIEADTQHKYTGNTVCVHGPVVITCNWRPPLSQILTLIYQC